MLTKLTKGISIILLSYILMLSQSKAGLETQNPAPFLSSPYYGSETLTRGFISGHEGQDYAMSYEPVLAATDGTITEARWENDLRKTLYSALVVVVWVST